MSEAVGVVGAGAMGAGIAQVAATAGYDVLLFDLDATAAAAAIENICSRIDRLQEKGRLDADAAAEAKSRISAAPALEDLKDCVIVVEAIVEKLEPKQALFERLDEIVQPPAILATNTSSLSVAAIASRCKNRERICGLHFFNPVPLMKLVEVVTQPGVSDAVIRSAVDFSERIGKVPVVVKDGPGFLVNLGGRAYTTESLQVAQEGVASAEKIDEILKSGFCFRMGPFELMDLTGIDVNYPATKFIYEGYRHDPRLQTTTLHELMFNAGLYGRKAGRGFYDYSEGGPKGPEPEAGTSEGLPLRAHIAGEGAEFGQLIDGMKLTVSPVQEDLPVLIAPVGKDATTVTAELGLKPANVVAIDFTVIARKQVTLMAPLGGGGKLEEVASWLRSHGVTAHIIKDSPGFVLQRVLAMIANLGCEMAQIGVGSPHDIDKAMQLGLNYPAGPLEIADQLGPGKILSILQELQSATGSDRYRPSLWLRRRALSGLSIWQED